MGNSKFFTNDFTNSLFDKFYGIIQDMTSLHSFHAVVGYFRSSGYFKIRKEFETMDNPPKIQILIGINIDNIFRKHNKSMMFLPTPDITAEAKERYKQDFIDDVRDAGYYKDIEEGILLLADDIHEGRVELKIHPTRDLHAKFYLFLPQKHTKNSDGWVIMGSSNLSDSGLGLTKPPRYELNVAMKDYDDVAFCKAEFDKLWSHGEPLTFEDIDSYRKKTYLGQNPTPYELYMKLLIDYFGDQVEDSFTLEMPEGFKKLKYQDDAVKDGYQKLLKNNGFFLADVVGLGKTVVATMIAKRFIEENGIRDTKILVIYPPRHLPETGKRHSNNSISSAILGLFRVVVSTKYSKGKITIHLKRNTILSLSMKRTDSGEIHPECMIRSKGYVKPKGSTKEVFPANVRK
ncbi:MAG: phospholipase D-like domain-containing protein [Alistipes sp.]|nr:phospholipase D-like domain-containing protein [Alistipes sp.]